MRNFLMIDTETANSTECPLNYDISWVIFNEDGEILSTKAFVVYEIYVLEKELMKSAYYAKKLPQYEKAIANGEKVLAKMETILKAFRADCKKWNVKATVAHNAQFDYRSCNTSLRYITKSENRFFFPYGMEIWDTLTMARDAFKNDRDYYCFCLDNDYLAKNGACRFTAEILYRFLSDNVDFEEKHIGIDDCLIEKEIFFECMRRKPNCNKSPWKAKKSV